MSDPVVLNKPAPQAQAPTESAPAQAPPPKEDPDFSRRFAALTKKERALLEREQKLKPMHLQVQEFEKIKALAKENPNEYLKHGGLTLDDLVQHMLKDGQPPSVEDRLAKLQEKIEADEKRKKEELELAQRRDEEAKEAEAIDNYKSQIVEFLNKDTSRFEAITTFKAFEPVFDKIRTYVEEHGSLPTDEQISAIADAFETEVITGLKAGLSLKKLGELAQTKTDVKDQAPQDTKAAPTLTNNTGPASGVPQKRKLTPDESKREAAKLLQWT